MRPGLPAVCAGHVFHRRLEPTVHEFRYPASYVWLDPDAPDELVRHHPLWSATRAAPARFRRSDYGDGSEDSLATQAREQVGRVAGCLPTGPVRMLTQVRRWGWLFNPITVYVVWDTDTEAPTGAVLEVTNTPWKERHHYAVALVQALGADGDPPRFTARVRKQLHVSPFLDEAFEYRIALWADPDGEATVNVVIDVVRPDTDDVLLTTAVQLERRPASRRSLGRSLRRHVAPTHRVSLGIHVQAARLWAKRVPFVAHPRRRGSRT
jgi:uncharacterized protein